LQPCCPACLQNYTEARKYFLKAAEKKLPAALNGLGMRACNRICQQLQECPLPEAALHLRACSWQVEI
jgi:hypothetical protein